MKNRLNNHELKREIGFFSATILVVANMIGTGIFTTSGFIMEELGNPQTMLLCWFVGGIFALCGALCYGELGAMFPKAGGEYVFLRESYGKGLAFLSGWISLIVGFSAPIAAAAIAMGLLSVLSAMIMTGPRVYYAMAKDSVFFELFGNINKVHRTPAYAILLQAAIAVAMVVTASFDKLLIYIGFTLALCATLTVVGMILLRITQPALKRDYKTFGYPVTPFLFILGNLWIIYFSIRSRPIASLFGLGTIGLGILVYLYFSIRREQNHDV